VAEFVSGVDATILRGRCLSYGEGITYWPVVEAILPLLGSEPRNRLAERGLDGAAAAVMDSLVGGEPLSTSPEELAWAVRLLLEEAADEHPLLVVLEDIHWGEPTFLELVEHVAGLSRGAPILLLCLARPELLDRRPSWGGGLLNATAVLLEAL